MESFHMPTRVIFGKGALLEHGHLMKAFGQKALIVTGRQSSRINGSLEDCITTLKASGIYFAIFNEVEENPSLETVEKGAVYGRLEKVDFIIGIGGGSPLDAAKAIAVFMHNDRLDRKAILETKGLGALPVIAVATTSGTGSEVTPYAIVTDHEVRTKRNLGQMVFPMVAYLDPGYTMDLCTAITINTAIDAFSHLAEGYLNTNATPWSDALAEEGFRHFAKVAGQLDLKKDLKDLSYEARAGLMRASAYGGMVISQTGTSLPHGMGYALTYHKGLPHGLANGVLYPPYLKSFKDLTKINRMATLSGFEDLEALLDFLTPLVATDVEFSDEEARQFAKEMASNTAKLKNHPEPVSEEDLYHMYVQMITRK